MNKKLTHISILVVLSVSSLICVSCSSLDRPVTFLSHRNHDNEEGMIEKEEREKEGAESIVTVKKSKLQNGIIKVIDKVWDQIIALTDPEEAKRQGVESYKVGVAMDSVAELRSIVKDVDQLTEKAEEAERAAIAAIAERMKRAESKESMESIKDQIAKAKQEVQAKEREVKAKGGVQEEATKRNAALEQKNKQEQKKAREEWIELVIAIAERNLAIAELGMLRAKQVILEKKDLLMAEQEGQVIGDEVEQLENKIQVRDIRAEHLVDIGKGVEARIQKVRDQVGREAPIEKLEKVEKQTGEVFRAAEKIRVAREEIRVAEDKMADIRRTREIRLLAKEAKQIAEKIMAQAVENTLNLSKKEREKAEQVINKARDAAFTARSEISTLKDISQPEQETILNISLVESAASETTGAAKELQVALLAAEAIQKVLHKKNDTRSGF